MTMLRPLIGIDFDGTIADTSDFKRRWAREHLGLDIPLGMCNRSGMLAAGLSEADYNRMLVVACDEPHTLAAAPPVQARSTDFASWPSRRASAW